MWDNAKLLNAIANALFVLAVALAAWAGVKTLLQSSAFPLRAIRVEGMGTQGLAHVGRREIAASLDGRLAGNFFNMDLNGVRAMFETIPWVRRAEVRRLWPDRLEVRLEEHAALARWGQPEERRLVNTHGELFSGAGPAELRDAELPQFSGPAGSETEVALRYDEFRRALAPLALTPRGVALSARYSWQLRLSNGLTLQLGRDGERDGIGERLARFVTLYPDTVAPLSRRLDYVDLRYPNGFALRVPGLGETDAAQGRGAQPKNAVAAPKLLGAKAIKGGGTGGA